MQVVPLLVVLELLEFQRAVDRAFSRQLAPKLVVLVVAVLSQAVVAQ
jgi:hypothetical protein